jgi:general secretion pathway protein J
MLVLARTRQVTLHRGFTLLELLVAIAIFAIVGVMALTGYTQLTQQAEYTQKRLDRIREVQRAVQTIAQDIEQLEPRPIRQPIGDQVNAALMAGTAADYKLEFTRAGWSNNAGLPRTTLQRVGYRLVQNQLWRDHWPVLDRTQSSEPVQVKLLTGVKDIRLRFMTPDRSWSERWPAEQMGSFQQNNGRERPAAVEVIIDLEDWGQIRRIIEVAG